MIYGTSGLDCGTDGAAEFDRGDGFADRMAAGIADDVRNHTCVGAESCCGRNCRFYVDAEGGQRRRIMRVVRKEHIRELKAKMQNAASQTGKLAGVGRMVSRSGDTSHSFWIQYGNTGARSASWNIFLSRALRR